MDEETGNAAAAAASDSEAAENAAEGSDGAEGGELEGTTPEEVASVLKSSGMNLPAEPQAAADDEEEGEELDEEAAEDEEGPETKTAATADTDKPATPAATDKSAAAAETAATEFTLEVEDKDGVTHKIEKIEDLPEDFEPKNNRQILQIINDLRKLDDQKATRESEQAQAAEAAETAKAVEAIEQGWQAEFKELNVNEEGRREEVMKFMSEENDKRQASGKSLIRTVEHALLGLEKQEAKAAAVEKAKADKETARKNGGLVGGSSAPASSGPKAYVAGSARNANEALRAQGLL